MIYSSDEQKRKLNFRVLWRHETHQVILIFLVIFSKSFSVPLAYPWISSSYARILRKKHSDESFVPWQLYHSCIQGFPFISDHNLHNINKEGFLTPPKTWTVYHESVFYVRRRVMTSSLWKWISISFARFHFLHSQPNLENIRGNGNNFWESYSTVYLFYMRIRPKDECSTK